MDDGRVHLTTASAIIPPTGDAALMVSDELVKFGAFSTFGAWIVTNVNERVTIATRTTRIVILVFI